MTCLQGPAGYKRKHPSDDESYDDDDDDDR